MWVDMLNSKRHRYVAKRSSGRACAQWVRAEFWRTPCIDGGSVLYIVVITFFRIGQFSTIKRKKNQDENCVVKKIMQMLHF